MVIHYLGWPQPMQELVHLARRREMLIIEDCALALLSQLDGRPLGSFGDWSIFCLYKTLPVPNGALLIQHTRRIESLEPLALRSVGAPAVIGRTAELFVQHVRGRVNGLGTALYSMKERAGRAASALAIKRPPVGDIGFNLDDVDLAMSSLSERVLQRLDFADICRRRVENFRALAKQLDGKATPVHADLPDGICPLFFPILVPDKHAAATALRAGDRRHPALTIERLLLWERSSIDPDGRFSPEILSCQADHLWPPARQCGRVHRVREVGNLKCEG